MLSETLIRTTDKLRQAAESNVTAFGAETHEFRMEPVFEEAKLNILEQQYRITLPEGYRQFLLGIGNGPAGPAYGLYSLKQALKESEPPLEMLQLCHEGCGYYHLLALSGPESGSMFLDGRVGDGGIDPMDCDFLTWYERWLDSLLAGQDGTWWLEDL